MQLRTKSCLDDIVRASLLIQSAIVEVSLQEYLDDWQKQSAVERQFTIIGEALVRIRRDEPHILEAIPDAQSIIQFRNLLVHGYDSASPKSIFRYAGDALTGLRIAVEGILADDQSSKAKD